MNLEVTKVEGAVHVDGSGPHACELTFDAGEALDLAQKLVAVAVGLREPAMPGMLPAVR